MVWKVREVEEDGSRGRCCADDSEVKEVDVEVVLAWVTYREWA